MAGDWIKMRTDLYRDPKVCVIAEFLMDKEGDLAAYVNQNCQRDMTVTRNVTRCATVGALVTVWGVMRHRGKRHGDDLSVTGVTAIIVDDIADLPGFGEAMKHAGWLIETEEGIVFPRFFEDYNVEVVKEAKSKAAERQARYRRNKCVTSTVTRDVTQPSQSNAREEKSREENNTPLPPTQPDKCVSDFPQEVQVKAREIVHSRWFALKGCLPNLERQDAKQEFREIADKISTHSDAYDKLKAYFASPPADHGKTVKLWVIFKHLGFDPEIKKQRTDQGHKLPSAEELAAKLNAENQKNSDPETRAKVKRVIEEAKKARSVTNG